MPSKATMIIKQVASKMTSFGFRHEPDNARARLCGTLSDTVEVWQVENIHLDAGGHSPVVFALVVNKGHVPLPAHHVVDFRVGNNIYDTPP